MIDISRKFGIKTNFIIEAGCHDGRDTKILLDEFPNAIVLAFEPDCVARTQAKEFLSRSISDRLHIFDFGLSNENKLSSIKYLDGNPGTGSSQISEFGDEDIQLQRLDECIGDLALGNGMLWLDVEGHAVQAIEGMKNTLRFVKSAKVEVQMHRMSENRPKDYAQVIELLREVNLYPVSAPLYPGFFGDIIFIEKSYLKKSELLISKFLTIQLWLLHEVIYPLLRKPARS